MTRSDAFPDGEDGKVSRVIQSLSSERGLLFFNAAFQSMDEAVIATDANFNVTFLNKSAEIMLGIKLADSKGRHFNLVTTITEDFPGQNKKRIEMIQSRDNYREEMLFKTEKGDLWLDVRTQAVRDRLECHGWLILASEVTRRRHTEEELNESEERYRLLIQNAPVAIVITTDYGEILEANRELLKMLGYASIEEFNQAPLEDRYVNIEDRTRWLNDIKAGQSDKDRELQVRKKDGTPIWVLFRAMPLSKKDGKQTYMIVNVDVTKRKLAEQSLRDSEERVRTILANTPIGIVTSDANKRFLSANDIFCQMIGYSETELQTLTFKDITHPDDMESSLTGMAALDAGKIKFFKEQKRYIKKDGSMILGEITVNAIRDENKAPYLYVAQLQDITERNRAEEVLRNSEQNFRACFDASPVALFIVDEKGEISYANQAMLHLYGFKSLEEFRNTPMDRRHTSQHIEKIKNLLADIDGAENIENSTPDTTSILRADGETRYVEIFRSRITWAGKPAYQIIYNDITERKTMQQHLIMQDRLASIGQLVSGVAHEINNPLTSVIGFSELLLAKKDIPEAIKADLQIINNEAGRTALIVANLLTFAREQPREKTLIDINSPVQTVLELRAHEQLVHNIRVVTHFAEDLPRIMGNNSQLQQVFFNIILNAEQAMIAAHQEGVLTITTSNSNGHVRATLTDDGPGMTEETMARMFIPFFTTKEVGKGTGLGLSICQGIVSEHNGRIWAESKPGDGTTFYIELPVRKSTF